MKRRLMKEKSKSIDVLYFILFFLFPVSFRLFRVLDCEIHMLLFVDSFIYKLKREWQASEWEAQGIFRILQEYQV